MESSSRVYDAFRKIWVSATPEEIVRQSLLQRMVGELHYPKELLVIEKELKQLPHLKAENQLPDRRADILCFAKNIHLHYALYPLLLIECKEGKLDGQAKEQVVGYNHFVKAFFIALANPEGVQLGYYDKNAQLYRFIPYLPSYRELLNAAQQ